jgi:hypothetical protein
MSSRAATLRRHCETLLAGRVAAPFDVHDAPRVETVAAGIAPIDRLTGGLPRGSLTEIYGPPSSGITSVLVSALASLTAASEVCALVDARDSFDPHSAQAAGVRLEQLLWIRCRNVDQAVRATDLLIQGGGFGLIALDLSDIPPQAVRYVPLNVWFRFRRAVEHTPTIFVICEQESTAKSCASLVLRMETQEARWRHTAPERLEHHGAHTPGCLLDGWSNTVEVIRSRARREGWISESLISAGAGAGASSSGSSIDFETQTLWNLHHSLSGKTLLAGGPPHR